jgi:RNA polymerase sigma-70 factor (family 1)
LFFFKANQVEVGKTEPGNIIKKLGGRDYEKTFKVFFDHYYVRMVKFAFLYVPQQAQAEDVVSEVMIKILKNRHKLHEIKNLEGYLFLSVKNQAISSLRQSPNYQESEWSDSYDNNFIDTSDNPGQHMETDELSNFIQNIVNNLPPQRQMVFKLVKEEGQKIKDVAELMELSPKTVKNHLDLAMKTLRQEVTAFLKDQPKAKIGKKKNNDGLLSYLFSFL